MEEKTLVHIAKGPLPRLFFEPRYGAEVGVQVEREGEVISSFSLVYV